MTVLTGIILLGVLATAVSLVWGIGSMAHGGDFDQRHGTQLMFARVGLQGVTLLLLIVALLASVR